MKLHGLPAYPIISRSDRDKQMALARVCFDFHQSLIYTYAKEAFL